MKRDRLRAPPFRSTDRPSWPTFGAPTSSPAPIPTNRQRALLTRCRAAGQLAGRWIRFRNPRQARVGDARYCCRTRPDLRRTAGPNILSPASTRPRLGQAAASDPSRLGRRAKLRAQDALWAANTAAPASPSSMRCCWKSGIDARQVPTPAKSPPPDGKTCLLASAGRSGVSRIASHCSPPALKMHSTLRLLKRRGPPCGRTLHLAIPRPRSDDSGGPWREPAAHGSRRRHPSSGSALHLSGLSLRANPLPSL